MVRERATWFYPVFHIFDSLGSAVLKVKGPMFHFGLCGESVPFEVTSVENGSQVVIKTVVELCSYFTKCFHNNRVNRVP